MVTFRASSIPPATLLTETKLEDSERDVNTDEPEETDVSEDGYEEACEEAADYIRS